LHKEQAMTSFNVFVAVLVLAATPVNRDTIVPGPAKLPKFTVECRILDKNHPFQIPTITIADGGSASVRDEDEVPVVVGHRTVNDKKEPITRLYTKGISLNATVTQLDDHQALVELDFNMQQFDSPPSNAEVRVHSIRRQWARRVPLGATTAVEIKDLKLDVRVARVD
jgi:hypothetical protein